MVMRSIASRMALWVLAGSALALGATGALLLDLTRDQILQHTHHEAAALAANAASKIQSRINRVEVSTRMLATILPTRQNSAGPLLRDAMTANHDMDGLAAVFKPPLAGSTPPTPSPFVSRDNQGQLTSRDLRKDANPYVDKAWFLGGMGCSAGCWQRVFFSLSRHRQLVNYSVAMMQNGRAIGLINADVTLDWLNRILGDLGKPAGAYAFVLDGDGNYLAHDNRALVGKRASPELLTVMASDQATSVRLPVAQNPLAHGAVWAYSAPIEGTHWRLGLVLPEARIYAGVRHVFTLGLVLGLLALLGMAMITLVTIRRMLTPLGVLADRAEHVARGELDFELPAVKRHDEIGSLTHSFDRMRDELALHMEDLARVAREKQRLASELEIAHQIQTGLLPNEHYFDASCAQFELHAALRPARAVGGDLYSYFMLDSQRLFVLVGDVSDKGIPAALFMAQTITLTKGLAPRAQTPDKLLQLLNVELCRGNDSCMFVTLLCGLLDTQTGRMSLASAGHEPPVTCGHGATQLIEIETGPVLGLHEDARYPLHHLALQSGQTLLMYTDGITEASNHALEMFGIDRTIECLSQIPAESAPAGYIHQLLADVDAFVADAPQADDITALALTWHGTVATPTEIRLPSQLADVFEALDRCDGLIDAATPRSSREDIRLVLEELMVNIVSYGYPDGGSGQIRLQLRQEKGATAIELHDDGSPFNPLQLASPGLTDHPEAGGLGVHLARTLTSEIRYTRDTHGNHLLLRFTHPHEGASTP